LTGASDVYLAAWRPQPLFHAMAGQGASGKLRQSRTKEKAMLVLSRKTGEKIRIGDNVTVTIVRIGPNNVRLGIDAPRDLNIVREELVSNEPVLNQSQSASESSVHP
jgi:carbon storage regulator